MPTKFRPKRRRGDNSAFESVWEKTNEPLKVRVSALHGPCLVIAAEGDEATLVEAAAKGVPGFVGEGFVSFTSKTGRVKDVQTPWRRGGRHGWFGDGRAGDSFENVDGDPVFSAPLIISSDGFNYFSLGGKVYNVDATYMALGCLSPTLLRLLRSWTLVCAGHKGRWEEEVGGVMETIQQLEKGARATIKNGDGDSFTVRGQPFRFIFPDEGQCVNRLFFFFQAPNTQFYCVRRLSVVS